jgi:hypothetical protein
MAAVMEAAVEVVETAMADERRRQGAARYCLQIVGGIISLLLMLTACRNSPPVLDIVELVDWKNKRNYEKILSGGGQKLLKISCRYIGKKPGDPTGYSSSHNYTEVDTSFYEVIFENLTDSELSIEGVTYRMDRGTLHGSSYYDADSIRRAWGTNIIPAGQSITRRNNMVWAYEPRNALIKVYTLRIRHSEDGKQDRIFSAQVPLRYFR